MRRNAASEKATKKWLVESLGLKGNEECWRRCFDLAEAAFILYTEEWKSPGGPRRSPLEWQWPAGEVARADAADGAFNAGSEPWTTLLREAYRLARAPSLEAKKSGDERHTGIALVCPFSLEPPEECESSHEDDDGEDDAGEGARLEPSEVPEDFPVRPLTPEEAEAATNPATCETCGLTWNDSEFTQYTPAPSGRCPFEDFHREA